MRDSEILSRHVDPATGCVVQCCKVPDDSRALFPWMGEHRWSAFHPTLGIYGMGVGNTDTEALAKYVARHPELRKAA